MRIFLPFLLLSMTASAQLTARLDSFFRIQNAANPGIAFAILKNGEPLYLNTAGTADKTSHTPIDSATNFRMASVTKQFTAMGILLLEKDGALTLDDPISRWLPELPANIGHHIQIRYLLTHSSGLLDYESLIPPDQVKQIFDDDVLNLLTKHDSTYFPPGTRFQYSNSGFCLLALIIQRASHETYAAFLEKRIFLPLHMDSSTVYQPGHYIPHRAMGYARDSTGHIVPSDQSITSATKGDGGVYTSLSDYAKWIRALQQNKLLRLADIMRRLRFPIKGNPGSYYAAGWFESTAPPLLLFHSGSTCGFNNFVIQIPGDEWSIVCFSNLADNPAPFASILHILKETGGPDLASVFSLDKLTR